MHTPSTGPSSPDVGRLSLVSSQDSQSSLTSIARRTDDAPPSPKGTLLKRSSSALGLSLCNIIAELGGKITALRTEKTIFIDYHSAKYLKNIQEYRVHIATRESRIENLEAELGPLKHQSDELATQLISYDQLITQAKAAHMATEDLEQRAQDRSKQYQELQQIIVRKTTRLLQYQDDIIKFNEQILHNEKRIDRVKQKADTKFDIQIESLTNMVEKYTDHH